MCHPIVTLMEPGPEQLDPILDRKGDVVVTAGAGAGKTRTIVARYLSLLAEGLPLRSIVAITFTRKAAREMRNRVRSAMGQHLQQPNLPEDEKRRWSQLYVELDGARIDTIHSLCSEILRAHPAEADIDPRFEVLDDAQAAMMRAASIDEALAQAAQLDVGPLFVLAGDDGVVPLLDTLLQKRLDVVTVFGALDGDCAVQWDAALRARYEQKCESTCGSPSWDEAVVTLRASAARVADDKLEVQRRDALDAIERLGDASASAREAWATLAGASGGLGQQKNWPGNQLEEVRAAIATLKRLAIAVLNCPPCLTEQDRRRAAAMPCLRALFERLAAIYARRKDEVRALDYDDLEEGALTVLREHPAARSYWQSQVQAILVDEFQDTNVRQRDLIALLNGDRGRLFVVGDAKQSIYRFRGADVTVFRAERQRIMSNGGQGYTLETSYRAHEPLGNGLNAIFELVLGDRDDPERPFVEPFAKLTFARSSPRTPQAAPYIEVLLAVGAKGQGGLDRAATALAARVLDWRRDGLGYGDIAILCRASTSFGAYEEALDAAGIPFVTVAGRGFLARPEVRDVLNALRAVSDPTDDLALAGLLRSPVVGLSDPALYRLCTEHRRLHPGDERPPLWETLCAAVDGDLFADETPQARAAVEWVQHLSARVGRTPVAGVIKDLLDRTAYRAGLLRAGQQRAARNVTKLLADAHQSGIVGVGEFLEYVNRLRDTGAREGEEHTIAEGSVQIMTVHAAKGLEFPVVVLGDITYRSPSRSDTLIDDRYGVLARISRVDIKEQGAIYSLAKERMQERDEAEAARLLYVAATRAQDRLVLNGCIDVGKRGQMTGCEGWLKTLDECRALPIKECTPDGDGCDPQVWELKAGPVPVVCTIYPAQWTAQLPSQPAPGADGDEPAPSLALLRPRAPVPLHSDARAAEREQDPPRRVWRVLPRPGRREAPAWVIGTLVHKALAAWRFPGPGFEQWVTARAREVGLTDGGQLRHAAAECARLLDRFRGDELFAQMDGASRRLHEVEYNLMHEGRVERGEIDVLYEHEGRWHIVEFKTDEVRDEVALQRLLQREDYLAQARRYQRAVKQLLQQDATVTLCMLNGRKGILRHEVR